MGMGAGQNVKPQQATTPNTSAASPGGKGAGQQMPMNQLGSISSMLQGGGQPTPGGKGAGTSAPVATPGGKGAGQPQQPMPGGKGAGQPIQGQPPVGQMPGGKGKAPGTPIQGQPPIGQMPGGKGAGQPGQMQPMGAGQMPGGKGNAGQMDPRMMQMVQQSGNPQPQQPFHNALSNDYNVPGSSRANTPYAPPGTNGGPAAFGMQPGNAGFGFGNGATRVPDTDHLTAGQFNPAIHPSQQSVPQPTAQAQQNQAFRGLPMYQQGNG